MIIRVVMGWVLGRFGFAASPIVLGLILGAIAEQGFVQGWTIGAAVADLPGMFFGRPISLAIIALTLLSLLYPLLRGRIFGRRGAAGGEGANVDCAIILPPPAGPHHRRGGPPALRGVPVGPDGYDRSRLLRLPAPPPRFVDRLPIDKPSG